MKVRYHSASGRYASKRSNKRRAVYGDASIGHKSTGHEGDCSLCGYPVTPLMGSVRLGEAVQHSRCPSLSERRRMRQMALENA